MGAARASMICGTPSPSRTIMGWYRKGLDPDREMIKLSTYLGHAKPDHTYWYIEAVPELLQLASERAERSLAASEGRCAMKTHALAPYLQRFFTERLGTQLKASPNTIIELSGHVPPAPEMRPSN